MKNCPNKEKNLEHCPCTYPGCDKKGICCECLKYHLSRKELPGCCFSPQAEKSFDRSFAKFAQDQNEQKS